MTDIVTIISTVSSLLLFSFFLGFSLVFAVTSVQRIEPIELFLICSGISVSITIITSVILNYFLGGIRQVPTALLICSLVLFLTSLYRGNIPLNYFFDIGNWLKRNGLNITIMIVLPLTAYAIIVYASSYQADSYTQLWSLPIYRPETDSLEIEIGVLNNETSFQEYRLEIISHDADLIFAEKFMLEQNGSFQITFSANEITPDLKNLETLLYKSDSPDVVYRKVSLNFD